MRAFGHLPVVWCFVPLHRPLGLVISSVIRLHVLITSYTIYFTICRFMSKSTHKGMHSVLALKLGVTMMTSYIITVPQVSFKDAFPLKKVRHYSSISLKEFVGITLCQEAWLGSLSNKVSTSR
jgi:hypothetical protein